MNMCQGWLNASVEGGDDQPVRSLAHIIKRENRRSLLKLKRRELRKKRFEPEGSEKYKEVNNNKNRCTKKAKENWSGELCCKIEEKLRENNSKRAYQLVKDLTSVKKRESIYCPRSFRTMPHGRTRVTEPIDRIQL